MGDEFKMLIAGIVLGTLFGFLVTIIVSDSDIKELGQAICDQEFGMDFERYNTKDGLICQPKVDKEEKNYDGVKISKEAKNDEIRVE